MSCYAVCLSVCLRERESASTPVVIILSVMDKIFLSFTFTLRTQIGAVLLLQLLGEDTGFVLYLHTRGDTKYLQMVARCPLIYLKVVAQSSAYSKVTGGIFSTC